jgi:hypothetical protein
MISRVVDRFRFVEEHPYLIKQRLLTEQDISTKFVLPMLHALNWDPLKITEDGPEIHEKGFRERKSRATAQEKSKKGVPDFMLRRPFSEILFFVEVKHPNKAGFMNPNDHLKRYRDGNIVLLTSFEKSKLFVIGKNGKKKECRTFTARSPEFYIRNFDNLWKHVSNSPEGDRTRAAIKANRPRQR